MEERYKGSLYSEKKHPVLSDLLKVAFGLVLFLAGTYALYPYCHYYVDPDSTAYLPIIERYATGDYYRAFNGLWSPLHPFLSSLLVRFLAMKVYDAALAVNILATCAIIFLSYRLFAHFRKSLFEQWIFIIFSGLFWIAAVYFQLVADQLGVALGLWALLFFFKSNLLKSGKLWLILGLISGIVVYAKTYNSYALSLILFGYLFTQWRQQNIKIGRGILFFVGYLFIFAVIAFPYLYLTHAKYGAWALGLTGKLNTAWCTAGRQLFGPQIKTLIPPIYPNSVSYWEDPFWVQGAWTSFTTSVFYFLRYLLRLGFNLTEWIRSMNHLSFLFSTIWVVSLGVFLKKHHRLLGIPNVKLILVNLLFPMGLLLVHIEPRYLWLSLFSILILGLIYLEKWLKPVFPSRIYKFFLLTFFGSFLIGSTINLKGIINTGKEEFALAQILKDKNIHGAFCSNFGNNSAEQQSILSLAYFSKNPFYTNAHPDQTTFREILLDARRYHVPYYYFFYKEQSAHIQLLDENGVPFPEVTHGTIPGLLIFRIDDSGRPSKSVLP